MERIFQEERTAGELQVIEVKLGNGAQPRPPRVERDTSRLSGIVTAHYDHDLDVLLVDMASHNYSDADYPYLTERHLETQRCESDAIRRAVEMADAWYAHLASQIPAYPSDEQVISEFVDVAAQLPDYRRHRWPFVVPTKEEDEIPF